MVQSIIWVFFSEPDKTKKEKKCVDTIIDNIQILC